mgnify:CR=1 FL=1
MPRIIDISRRIGPDLPVWPGDPAIELRRQSSVADGDLATVSRLSCGSHSGTHVDAPLHFFADGASLDDWHLAGGIGPCQLIDCPGDGPLSAADLQAQVAPGCRRLLIRSRNSADLVSAPQEFRRDYVALSPAAADWLVDAQVRLVGVDGPSVAPFDDPEPVHHILLGAGCQILEGLTLAGVETGVDYVLCCLPLPLAAADGAPARAVLIADLSWPA